MDVLIRTMIIEDYDEVIALWKSCEGIGLSSADQRESIAVYLERNPGQSFVAMDGKRLAGAVLCGSDGRRGFIHHLAVHPDYRRFSIGRQLADHCLQALHQIGIAKCHLFVFTDNKSAIEFWQQTGWSQRTELVLMSRSIGIG